MFSPHHNTKDHREWRKGVRVACNNRCYITGDSGEDVRLDAHHIIKVDDAPELALSIENGVMLRSDLHVLYHTAFLDGYHASCDGKSLDRFKETFNKIVRLLKNKK